MSDTSPSKLPAEIRTERGRWDRLARDPYYTVINDEGYRDDRLTELVKERFDRSGEEDVALTLTEIRRWIDPQFRPRQGVDLGCGIGRLTIPLSRACERIAGVDISEVMLHEARRNAASHGVTNATFVSSPTYFGNRSGEQPRPDFIHSYIVLQHIPPPAGMWIIQSLLERLVPGGVGALHFTFARRASVVRRISHQLRLSVPGVNVLANVVKRRPLLEPLIPMHNYDLAAVLSLLGDHGCGSLHARLTDHGGHLGAMFIFQRA